MRGDSKAFGGRTGSKKRKERVRQTFWKGGTQTYWRRGSALVRSLVTRGTWSAR